MCSSWSPLSSGLIVARVSPVVCVVTSRPLEPAQHEVIGVLKANVVRIAKDGKGDHGGGEDGGTAPFAHSHTLLAPFESWQVDQFMCEALGVDSVPASVEEVVYAKTKGHPLFTSEMVKLLLENGNALLHVFGLDLNLPGRGLSVAKLSVKFILLSFRCLCCYLCPFH